MSVGSFFVSVYTGGMKMWLNTLMVFLLGIGVGSAVVWWQHQDLSSDQSELETEMTTTEDDQQTETGSSIKTDEAGRYHNDLYGFSMILPADWEVIESFSTGVPLINSVPKSTTATGPFTHHNEVLNVSVFPQGVPTEGVAGVAKNITSPIPGFTFRAYTLEDGTVWGWYGIPDVAPAGWNESGFVWARAVINNESTHCYRAGNEIIMENCDPLAGDEVTRTGSVSSADSADIAAILKSFSFSSEN